jgi:protein TonB
MASVSQMQTEDKPILDKPTPSAPALKKPSPPPRAAAQQLGEKSRAEKSRTEGRAAAESRGAQTSALAPPHYLTAVFARVQQAKRYPAKAQARGDQGRAVVSISIRRNGALAEARLVRSSGSSLLDEATLEAMRRAAPFPPLPPDVAGSVLVLSVPMNFTIE